MLCLLRNLLQYESIPGEKGPVVRPIVQTAGFITRTVLDRVSFTVLIWVDAQHFSSHVTRSVARRTNNGCQALRRWKGRILTKQK